MMISVRRFCWRPSGVSFDATGSVLPRPSSRTRPGSLIFEVMISPTDLARASDR
jgi:hypothetical protein